MNTKHSLFSRLLHTVLVGTDKGETVPQLATKMDIPKDTFWKYLLGYTRFPVELIGQLTNATGNVVFLNSLVQGTKFMIALRPILGAAIRNPEPILLELIEIIGYLIARRNKFISDGNFDIRERKLWNKDIDTKKIRISYLVEELDKGNENEIAKASTPMPTETLRKWALIDEVPLQNRNVYAKHNG